MLDGSLSRRPSSGYHALRSAQARGTDSVSHGLLQACCAGMTIGVLTSQADGSHLADELAAGRAAVVAKPCPSPEGPFALSLGSPASSAQASPVAWQGEAAADAALREELAAARATRAEFDELFAVRCSPALRALAQPV